ncbi:MAG TPA: DUF2058 family protein [Vulgatibacter sp.]|nr:DUF2058 family protein [Vulgatibacter sp.]
MGLQSLRDKLLQAGLVTEDQAKKAEEAKAARRGPKAPDRANRRASDRPQPGRAAPAKALSPEEQRKREEDAAFRERERMLNREREENRRRAAEDRKKLEGLLAAAEKHEVTERGDEAFHFTTRRKKVQRIYLTADQLRKLETGDLAIIDKPTPAELSFALVTREGAERALALDPKAVRFYNRGFGQTFGFKAEAPQPDAAEALEGTEPAGAAEAPEAQKPSSAEDETPKDVEAASAGEVEPKREATASAAEAEPKSADAASAAEVEPKREATVSTAEDAPTDGGSQAEGT